VTVLRQFGHELSLPGNVSLALGYVPLSLCKIPFEPGAIFHALASQPLYIFEIGGHFSPVLG
jgi:hypothetical protein